MLRKIQAILRIAKLHQQRALVLGAFGCGVSTRSARLRVRELFADVLLSFPTLSTGRRPFTTLHQPSPTSSSAPSPKRPNSSTSSRRSNSPSSSAAAATT